MYNRMRIEFAWSIGHGGQADVYLVRAADTGLWMAAKVLREAWDPIQRAAFMKEAERQHRCAGPGVVPLLGWNMEAPKPFILVPYMPSGTLRDHLKAQADNGVYQQATYQALAIARQIAQSLVHIHQRDIVHRDLKPENILIDQQGQCIINDFGLAATVIKSAYLFVPGFVGTPLYAAPEQFQGIHIAASDVWALGLILNELLTGQPLPRAWASFPTNVGWPSYFHNGNQYLDLLVRALANPNWRLRPSALEALQLIDAEMMRLQAWEQQQARQRVLLALLLANRRPWYL